MIKKKRIISGFSIMMVSLMGLFMVCSCEKGSELSLEPKDEIGVPLQLSVSLAANDYSSDSEIIPMAMNTRAENSYVVTRVVNHALFVLKKMGADWIVVDIRDGVIEKLDNDLLKKGEPLKLNDKGRNFVLLPGEYKFLLFVNTFISKTIKVGTIISNNSIPVVTSGSNPPADFYFAEDQIKLEKTTGLNQEKTEKIMLNLERKSALIRFILVGKNWTLFGAPFVVCKIQGEEGKVCIGMNIFGEAVYGNVPESKSIDIKMPEESDLVYRMGNEEWHFSSIKKTRNNLSIYAVDKSSENMNLTITRVGGENSADYWFEGEHKVTIPIQRNHITTILIRKEGVVGIKTEINPSVDNWSGSYPPIDYIELNN